MRLSIVACLAAALARPVAAGEAPARPKVGLVLSGGSAHGLAHVGVLKVLEELRVPVDVVAGTSMGSIVGGLFASGMSPREMEALLSGIDWQDLLDDRPARATLSYRRKQDDVLNYVDLEMGLRGGKIAFPSGLIAGQKLSFLLKSLTLGTVGTASFDALPIPFRCVATDLATGEKVVLSGGSLAEAVRASMSLPGAFSPVRLGSRLLVDGGLVDNLPVAEAEAMGAQALVAVDVSSDEIDPEQERSFGGVVGRVIALPIRRNVAASRPSEERGVLLAPRVADIPSMDFARAAELVARGEAAARAAAPRLSALSVSEEEYRAWREKVRGRRPPPPVVDAVQITSRGVDTRQITSRLSTKEGRPLDVAALRRDLDRIYEMGIFETVEFRLVPDDGKNVLVIDAKPKSWGPTFLRIGSGFETNFQGDTALALRGTLHAMQLNALGAELKLTLEAGSVPGLNLELYQPFDFRGRTFGFVEAAYSRSIARVAVPGGPSGEGRLWLVQGIAGAGVAIGSFGQVRLGLFRGEGKGDALVMQQPIDSVDVSLGGYSLDAGIDTLDSRSFARHGVLVDAGLEVFRPILGTGVDCERLRLRGVGAMPLGPTTAAVLNAGWEDTLGSHPPFYLLFTLADFSRMAALARENEAGERAAYSSLSISQRVGSLPTRLGRGIYVGGTFELGRVWADRTDASVANLRAAGGLFAGADTVLGPIYLGFGLGYGGTNTLYLFLGRPF